MPSTVLPEGSLETTVWIQTRIRSPVMYVHTQVLKSTKHWEINLSVHPPNSLGTGWDCVIYKERRKGQKECGLRKVKKLPTLWDGFQIQVYYISFFQFFFFLKAVLALKRQKQEDCQEFQASLSYIMRLYLKTNKHTLSFKEKEKTKRKRQTDRGGGGGGEEAPQKKNLSLRETNSI